MRNLIATTSFRIFRTLLIVSALFAPLSFMTVVHAQGDPYQLPDLVVVAEDRTFADVLDIFVEMLNTILPLIVAACLLVFFWGLIRMIRGTGDTAAIEAGKTLMIWGIIALFVMVSFVGILNLVSADFFGTEVGIPQLPVPEGGSSTP